MLRDAGPAQRGLLSLNNGLALVGSVHSAARRCHLLVRGSFASAKRLRPQRRWLDADWKQDGPEAHGAEIAARDFWQGSESWSGTVACVARTVSERSIALAVVCNPGRGDVLRLSRRGSWLEAQT